MGNANTIQKCNYEDIQDIIRNKHHNNMRRQYILIHTLDDNELSCIIPTTLTPNEEVRHINSIIQEKQFNIPIVLYGLNCSDKRVIEKYNKLSQFGFQNIFIYIGGLFEWLCLQDIYGEEEFPTTSTELDILKFKPIKNIKLSMLMERNTYYLEDTNKKNGVFNVLKNLF